MPSLNVPRVSRTNCASSISSTLLNSFRCGTVASPTPTVPISSDSTSRTEQSASSLENAAAAIQPAVPPPTITMLRTGGLLMRCSRCVQKGGGHGESDAKPAFSHLKLARPPELPPPPRRELEGARHSVDVAGGVVGDREKRRVGRVDIDEVLVVEGVQYIQPHIHVRRTLDLPILDRREIHFSIAEDRTSEEETLAARGSAADGEIVGAVRRSLRVVVAYETICRRRRCQDQFA